MRSNYKRIGKYIQLVDERNKDLKVDTLLGLTIDKEFISSVANIVGANMANYKIIRKDQFACSLMQVRRDKKIPVALLREFNEAIISQAYPVFEIADSGKLLPEYLMMWMSRSEFDREACFYAVGGVRGSLEWEDFCNMELPVPSPEKQREIFKEYHTIVNRIKLNEQLNRKLEETAQAIYKQWFVDFDFPISAEYAGAIGKPELEDKPYKSSGGEMVYNDELDQAIPKGWEVNSIKSIAKDIICGKTPSTYDESNFGNDIPFITIPDMHNKVFVDTATRYLSQKGARTQKNKMLPPNSICVSCIASPGIVILTTEECQTNQQINSVICKDDVSFIYGFFSLRDLGHKIREWGIKGSVGANMNKSEFSLMKIIVPPSKQMSVFHSKIEGFFDYLKNYQKEWHLLFELKELAISRMVLGK